MANPLDSAYQKVMRARKHLDEVQRETRAFTESNPYGIAGQPDPLSGHYVLRFSLRDPNVRPPIRLGLAVGDAAHNLRSALDHLAWQLAIIGTGPGRHTQFPIFDDADAYGRSEARLLEGIVDRHRAAIELLQPYRVKAALKAGLSVIDPRDPLAKNMFLLAIGRLDNMDKHRLLLPVTSVAPFRQPKFRGVKRAKGTYPGHVVRVEDGAEFYRITEWETLPDAAEVQLETLPTYTIEFGDPEFGPFGAPNDIWSAREKGATTSADLRLACDVVDEIIGSFLPDFA